MKDHSNPAQLKNSPSVIDAGSGYRLLARGEAIQEGDDVLLFGRWTAVRVSMGDSVKASDVGRFRRKLRVPQGTPPAGYRWLVEGEEIRPGDRYVRFRVGNKLSPAFPDDSMCVFRDTKVGDCPSDFTTEPWVRPVEAAAQKLTRKLESATAKIAGQKRAADSANREIVRLRASAADLQARLEVMQKNASGNIVLVRRDGFSLPVTVPFTPRPLDVASADSVMFAFTARKDGFGRQVFEQV